MAIDVQLSVVIDDARMTLHTGFGETITDKTPPVSALQSLGFPVPQFGNRRDLARTKPAFRSGRGPSIMAYKDMGPPAGCYGELSRSLGVTGDQESSPARS